MNDEYRFRLRDVATQAAREMSMICLDDEAALLLAERFALGSDVEVWEGDRFLGLVASSGPALTTPAASEPVAAAAPSPTIVQPASPPARRFKPFWAGAWRRGAEQT